MIKKYLLIMTVIFVIVFLAACSTDLGNSSEKTELIVSAASSLTDVLNELKDLYETKYPDTIIILNFGSSGALARQIENGAPVDIYLSANQKFMSQLEDKGFADKSTRFDLTGNQMVLISNKELKTDISSFMDLNVNNINLIAIGDPESVPAGRYAKEIFKSLNMWNVIKEKLVFAKDVRQVLAYVETGNADYGIVYASDILITNNVKVVAIADENWHQRILYPGAILKNSKQKEKAEAFIDFLTDEQSKLIFQKFGFR